MTTQGLHHPRTRSAFRVLTLLVTGYLAISVVTLVAIVLLRHHAAQVNSTVWTRGSIVVVTAALLLLFAGRAARGERGAYRRLRIVSIIMVVAIAAIVATPGALPLWMKLEQGVCGIVMLGVVAVSNSRQLRALFANGLAEEQAQERATAEQNL